MAGRRRGSSHDGARRDGHAVWRRLVTCMRRGWLLLVLVLAGSSMLGCSVVLGDDDDGGFAVAMLPRHRSW